MNVFGQLWQAKVDEFHFLHSPETDGAHKSLQEQVTVLAASIQRADKNTVENLESFQAAAQTEKFDQRIEIFQIIDNRGSLNR